MPSQVALIDGLIILVGLLLIGLVAWLVSLRTRRTLKALTVATRSLSQGDFQVEVPIRSRGPAGELARAFNEMAHQLSASRQQITNYQKTLETRVRERTRELHSATLRAVQIAQTDPLTSLPNRLLFRTKLEESVKSAAADKSRVAVLFVDLDFFKNFNDSLGHDAGDAVLRAAATRLQDAVRQDDVVARFGGDEFVVLISRLEAQHAEHVALTVAEGILETLSKPFDVAGTSLTMPASLGIAIYPHDGANASELIKNADTAMYAAKQAGRNRIEHFSGGSSRQQALRTQFENDIRRGLAAGEFFLMFQPQVDSDTGSPTGLEALLRWRHQTRGLIQPAEFIPIAEESGIINPLGQRALAMACEQFKLWQGQDIHPRISVNVSARQLADPGWLKSVDDTIARTGIPPNYLDLEITESMLVGNPQNVIDTLDTLGQMGVTLTLDDFGTGYSSLSYLTRLPFHTIKIDRSFIQHIDEKPRRGIVQAIVAIAHSLGMRIIAEGVETPLQLSILREIGCEEIQGFYIAKPLDANAIESWWRMQLGNVGVMTL
ncbi:MAG TPA: EAL domain-containing protein [Casimicrobium huifangae]|jgi:diguanylate cyclase (GGDEF)-like protein|uniref:putative bifunctional diguanylate cyclase/phosphodiesterase n=1 Tax=Casimicrobium huifangae TaxID=2591109 RepID=UPI001396C669|nr:EAL domain-containing protein [Casimicrobium huifangae]HOB00854.1 EAL domain-containing protein [Casimicrobium huifangae]HQA32707.1 EAL domain-containing protein [Casimicrobium huifangae]HQD65580.1 EAL domain-containing protein [Casimicrobium huifangae]